MDLPARSPTTHVVLIDGTFASLVPSQRSSIGRIHSALSGNWGPRPLRTRVYYAPGQQWLGWRRMPALTDGKEIEQHIVVAYDWLSRRWQDGDRVFLFGYSRGAFAVRSLAGLIGKVGLIRRAERSDAVRNEAWRLYRQIVPGSECSDFRRRHCHVATPITFLGVFDTVMALGIRLPLIWMLSQPRYRFHNLTLGDHVERGVQALAIDETRAAFQPILWSDKGAENRILQMWFRGTHPDIGGQLSGAEYARPLANIPLHWMLEQAQISGLPLPEGWRDRVQGDASAPSVGSWRGWGKAFIARAPRIAGSEPTEHLHPTVPVPYGGPGLLTGDLARYADDTHSIGVRRRKRRTPPDPDPDPA